MKVEDGERQELAADLRAAVAQSGLSQADFARHLGTSATRLSTYLSGSTIPSAAIYLRALRLGTAIEHVHQKGLMTPDDAVDAVNKALADEDEDFALRMILQARDDLRRGGRDSDDVRRAWAHRARTIHDDRFDTLFRAIAAHELKERVPTWATDASLAEDWVVPDPFRDDETVRRLTPDWLARAHIFIAERGLVTA